MKREYLKMSRVFEGIAISPGVAKGRVVFALHVLPQKSAQRDVDFTSEVRRFFRAISSAKRDLELMKTRISKGKLHKEVFDVIEVYLLFLEDPTLADFVVERIREGYSAEESVREFFEGQMDRVKSTSDEYLRERVKDLKYVKRLLLSKLHQQEVDWESVAKRGDILVSHFLSPVDVVKVAEKGIKGIIVEKGSQTSHTGIVARSVGIPMVKLPDATEVLSEGDYVLVDGHAGRVVVDPAPDEEEPQKAPVRECVAEKLPVSIYANIDFPEEAKVVDELGADGVGIFRTEYIYLVEKSWPSEDVQVEYIKRLLSFLDSDLPVTIRIADLGGDKIPLYAEHMMDELDYRGIRFFMLKESFFRTHIRAILKAFEGRELRLLVPMVSDVYEMKWTKEIVREEMNALRCRPEKVLFGAMIETPAGVIGIRSINEEVDFISIGSNDLTGFLFGMDRECKIMDYMEPPNNMAMVECVRRVVKVCSSERVTLCGEIARDRKYLPYLLKAGLRKLSVNPAFIPELRQWLVDYLEKNKREQPC